MFAECQEESCYNVIKIIARCYHVHFEEANRHSIRTWTVVQNYVCCQAEQAFFECSIGVFGAGMCMIMVYNMMFYGIIVGVVGILLLLFLIPMCLGLKDSKKEEVIEEN